jgi:hypothetical protein
MENEETLEEFIIEVLEDISFSNNAERAEAKRLIEIGAIWQQERMYSEEEVLEIIEFVKHLKYMNLTKPQNKFLSVEILEQFKSK